MISSTQNPRIKSLVALHQAKGRRENACYLIEGIRFVETAMQAQAPILEAYYAANALSDDRGQQLLEGLAAARVDMVRVSEQVLKVISHTQTPQGIVAKVQMLQHEPRRAWPSNARLVLVDRVQDPGNLGTIIRTAAANAVDGVILLRGTVDLYNDKVLRSTMGALWQIPIITDADPLDFIAHCKSLGLKIVAAVLDGEYFPHQVNLADGVVVVVGNEGTGVSSAICSAADLGVKIPMLGETESLNVAVANGVLLYEGTRQRLEKLAP